MSKRLPISAAENVAKEHDLRQVILLAWDGELTHIVTFGKTVEDCAQAAQGGNILKEKWGWPECNDQPSRAKKAVEFGGYLADSAEQFIKAINDYEEAEATEEGTGDVDLRSDCFRGLKNAIYEFRKRATAFKEGK